MNGFTTVYTRLYREIRVLLSHWSRKNKADFY